MRAVAPLLIAAMLVAAASGDRRDAATDAARRAARLLELIGEPDAVTDHLW